MSQASRRVQAPQVGRHRGVRGDEMPAGLVLVAGLAGMLLAALMTAPSLLHKATSEPFCSGEELVCWRDIRIRLVWSPLAWVSAKTGLSRPATAVREWLGRPVPTEPDANPGSERVRRGRQGRPALGRSDLEDRRRSTVSVEPRLRTPGPDAPLRVYVGGDSMMQALGESLLSIMERSRVMDAEVEARIATGLTRPDFFDWPRHLRREVLPSDPELVLLMFGANDAQGIQLPDGSVRRRFEQGWLDEYRRRVAEVMDLLRDPEGDRLVVWVGQPPMRPGTVAGVEKMNSIYWEEAGERPWVAYFDSWPFFATREDQYADYLANAAGEAERVRKQDGIHFTRDGADRLAAEIYERLTRLVDLSRSGYSPSPDDLAPPDVHERPELPPPVPELIR